MQITSDAVSPSLSPEAVAALPDEALEEAYVVRFDAHQRIQHILMIGSFLALVVTGFPQKFPSIEICQWLMDVMGGIQTVRLVHRIAGGIMIFDGIYHMAYISFTVLVLQRTGPLQMIPNVKDVKDAVRTVQYFARHPEVQLVVRIHPGERITKGPSVAGVVQQALPEGLPGSIYLVPADAQVNTYDLIEIADLGLVYTTTVGMEMAMSGIPTIVIGQTHYRGKGFTLDPDTWQAYFDLLDRALVAPREFRLSQDQVNDAWEYAYRFFFEYPHPFPWHLVHMWEDVKAWPVGRVLSEEGQAAFGDTFRYLAGKPVDWSQERFEKVTA